MRIERVPISKLKASPYNPRKDLKPGDPEYEALKKSVERWGMVDPIIYNRKTGNVVGGHQRLKILKARGDKEADVSVVELDELEEKALNMALNKGGQFDIPKVLEILLEIDAANIDVSITGFDLKELEKMVNYSAKSDVCPACGSPKLGAPKRVK